MASEEALAHRGPGLSGRAAMSARPRLVGVVATPSAKADLAPLKTAAGAARLRAFVVADSRAASARARARRKRKTSTRVRVQRSALGFLVLAVIGSALGLVFAGSPERIAAGVQIDGINVGGMKPDAAQRLLERRARRLERVSGSFFAGDPRWRLVPQPLGGPAGWAAALVVAGRPRGGGGAVRGVRR